MIVALVTAAVLPDPSTSCGEPAAERVRVPLPLPLPKRVTDGIEHGAGLLRRLQHAAGGTRVPGGRCP